jgi:hypothetical protein
MSHLHSDENMIPPSDQEGAVPALRSAGDEWVGARPDEDKATNRRGLSAFVIVGS